MPTLTDVANVAEVSHMTVSRFFNNPSAVSPNTRDRVREAVEKLNYVPNGVARSLASGSTKVISLIVTDITNPFFTTLARGVEDEAEENGYLITLGNTDESVEIEERYMSSMVSRRVDGVIIAPAPGSEKNLKMLEDRDIPTVLVDRNVPSVNLDVVQGDTFRGAKRLVNHLLDEGYDKIAFIGGTPKASSLEHRLSGYREMVEEADIGSFIQLGDFTQASGKEIVGSLVQDGELPDALIAANNLVAVGALAALDNADLSVPEDVALACFEELGLASTIDPFLTVVRQPSYEIGRKSFQMLLDRIQGHGGSARDETLSTELVVRNSTQRS